jgi:hypothetical protein
MMTKKVYEGQLIDKNNSNNVKLFLDKYEKPLKTIINDDSEKYGNYLIVKYWISDKKLSISELDEKFMDTYYNTEKNGNIIYFEISEYLWKDEGKGCKHDLIGELTGYIGKYGILEIDFSKEPQSVDKSFI